MTFNKLKSLTKDADFITNCLKDSKVVEIKDGMIRKITKKT